MDASTEKVRKEEFNRLYDNICENLPTPTTVGELSAIQTILLMLAVQAGVTFFKDTPDALDHYDVKMQSLFHFILATVCKKVEVGENASAGDTPSIT